MKIKLQNHNGVEKEVKVGFSWTTLFFGFFPALFRGDLKWAIIILLIEVLVGSITYIVGAWVVMIVFAFIYNKIYIRELLKKGFRPLTEEDQRILASSQNR